MKASRLLAFAASVLVPTFAAAAVVDVDLTGFKSIGGFSNPANSRVIIPLGAGAVITGVTYENVAGTPNAGINSWGADLIISVDNTGDADWIDFLPAPVNNSSPFGPLSGDVASLPSGQRSFGSQTAGLPITIGVDGNMHVYVYEGVDDSTDDSVVETTMTAGVVHITYTPIPEPASLGLLGLGALALRRRH